MKQLLVSVVILPALVHDGLVFRIVFESLRFNRREENLADSEKGEGASGQSDCPTRTD